MPNQQERAELHKTIWKIANDLRGSVDGWEFKAYVLGSIFYRFISENICDYIHQIMTEAGQPDFDYAAIDDAMAENIRKKMVEEKGYFILPSQLFQNLVKTAKMMRISTRNLPIFSVASRLRPSVLLRKMIFVDSSVISL